MIVTLNVDWNKHKDGIIIVRLDTPDDSNIVEDWNIIDDSDIKLWIETWITDGNIDFDWVIFVDSNTQSDWNMVLDSNIDAWLKYSSR